MRSILIFLALFTAAAFARAACDDSLASVATRNDVLVVVNDNATDSCEVGRYYAAARQLAKPNVLHIKAPASYYIDWTQFEAVREQIFRALADRISAADPTFVLSSCAPSTSKYCAATVAQIKAKTQVKVLVTTWGMPSRIVGVPQDSTGEPASFDDYLRMSMVNYITGIGGFANWNSSTRRDQIEQNGYRAVNPAIDSELVIGRVDGLTADAAKQLVNRAVAAEKNGFLGKAFWDIMHLAYTDANNNYFEYAGFHKRFPTWLYTPNTSNNFASENIVSVNGVKESAWRYVFGLFDEKRDKCVGYSAFYMSNGSGKAPFDCKVKLENQAKFGQPASRATIVDNASLYMGNLDGQPTYAPTLPFETILNWRKAAAVSDTPTPTACGYCQDAQCKSASTDAFKEIDTSCAGVAEGFIGYNYQSYPVAYLASWPTGWRFVSSGTTGLDEDAGGDALYLALPEVIADSADAIGGAVYFGQSKSNAATNCYVDSGLTAQIPCVQKQAIYFGQSIKQLPVFNYAPNTEYELKFKYKKTVDTPDFALRVYLHMNAKDGGTNTTYKEYNYGTMKTSPSTDYLNVQANHCVNSWCQATFNLVLNPATAGHVVADPSYTDVSYNGLKFFLFSSVFQGDLIVDDFSLVEKRTNIPVTLNNPSFDGGHKQFTTGDHAATFLSRLNGTAFFGSMSHHRTDGHSFGSTAGDNIVQLIRGMPLGEAIWLGNGGGGSGVLYGDPLYSPVAVSFNRAGIKKYISAGDVVALSGYARNGTDPQKIATTYTVDYCLSADFYICDHTVDAWQSTGVHGDGATGLINLGNFNTAGYPIGPLLLRLNVKSTDLIAHQDYVLHDFLNIILLDPNGNPDNDGLTNAEETSLGTDPNLADTDSDGIPDGWEFRNGYNPLEKAVTDSDGDGLTDEREIYIGSNPHNIDSDGDGYTDAFELSPLVGGNLTMIMNDQLHPTRPIASIPLFAGVGHTYRVVLQLAPSYTDYTLTPVTPLLFPAGATLTKIGSDWVFEWTPTTVPALNKLQRVTINLKKGASTVQTWFEIKVVPLDGDLNEDGVFDLSDILLMQKIVSGAQSPTAAQIFHADFYPASQQGAPDDKLDLSDLMVMQKKLFETNGNN